MLKSELDGVICTNAWRLIGKSPGFPEREGI